MIATDALYLLCQDVMAAVEAGYAAAGAPLPDRRYVANGEQQVAFDCEQVTVAHQITQNHGGALLLDNSARLRDPAHAMRFATIAVTIVRCAPVADDQGTPPPVADEEASAMTIYEDTQLAFNSLLTAQKAGRLGGCGSVMFLDCTTPGSSGTLASSKLRVALGLE